MKTFCENTCCKTPAVKEDPISVRRPAEQKRPLCATGEEVYTGGVRHSRMSHYQRQLWILAIAESGVVVETSAHRSQAEAQQALIRYLRQEAGWTGPHDITAANQWLAEHDERLSVKLSPVKNPI